MSLKDNHVVVPVKRGRPRKADIEAKKKRSVRGRPPGEAARIKEFYARLLSTSGDKVVIRFSGKHLMIMIRIRWLV